MDKIIFFMLSIMIFSCSNSNKFDRKKNKLIFIYTPEIKIDFESKVLKIDYERLRYTDTLNLSKEEENTIIDSFNKNKIYDVKGDVFCADGIIDMPPSNFTIQLFNNDKLQSEIIINDKYENKNKMPFGQEYRVVSFRDDVLKILKNNKGLKKALNIFKEYQKDNRLFSL